jgi:hypothetical protein
VTVVVNELGQQIRTSASHLLLGFFGRLVITRTSLRGGRLGRGRVAGRSEGSSNVVGIQRGRGRGVVIGRRCQALAKDVADGRQAVVGLVSRHMVDVRSARQVGGLVGDVTSQGCRVLAASETVAEGSRLDDPLVGKLLVGRRNNGKAGRGLVSARHARGLCGELQMEVLVFIGGSVTFSGLLVKPSLNQDALLVAH